MDLNLLEIRTTIVEISPSIHKVPYQGIYLVIG